MVLPTPTHAMNRLASVFCRKQPDLPARRTTSWAKTLNDQEIELQTTHRGCLYFLWAVLSKPFYLEGDRLLIRTDDETFRCLLTTSDTSGKITRWILRLFEVKLGIVHRAGIKHQVADATSRLQTEGTHKTELDDDILVLAQRSNKKNTDGTKQGQEGCENYKERTEQESNPYHNQPFALGDQDNEI